MNNSDIYADIIQSKLLESEENRTDLIAYQYFRKISEQIKVMDTERRLNANASLHPGKGIRYFLRRVIRKLLRWYIDPVCEQQTKFNEAALSSIEKLNELNSIALQKIADLESRSELSKDR